jgi:CheY-like chemotaxis protein
VTAMLDDPSTPAPLRPGLDMFRRNIALEAHLIDDLLDLTRIRRGEFSMRRETIDAHEQIDRALELCSDEAHNANVTLVAQLKAEAHHVDADPIRFQQVLWNLLKNAIKFSLPGGTVTIRSRNRAGAGREMGESWQVIEVIDRGIGIEPELLPRIFDLFVQGELAKGRRRGGLGLGLAISRMIVEHHGGRLVASSEGEGRGATFTLEFPTVATPLEASPARPPKPGVAIRHGPLKILLVEDNKDTLGALSAMLAKQGHDVRTAGTLADALRVVEECKLEMVISDIELPDGTGLDLMRELRGRGAVPGIAISGFGSSEDIKMSRSAGFAEHLTKPILFRQLEEAIQRVTADSQVERLTET